MGVVPSGSKGLMVRFLLAFAALGMVPVLVSRLLHHTYRFRALGDIRGH